MARMLGGIGTVILAAVAGFVSSAVLYLVVVGLTALIAGDLEGPQASLFLRARDFGITFGLLSGAHWGLAGAHRLFGADRGVQLAVRVMTIPLGALGIVLALAGARWDSMFAGLAGSGVVLVVAWVALTHVVSKAVGKRTPAGNPAGAR